MTTYEQKYGRLPDSLANMEEPPEDWQFETPLVSVSMDGNVKSRLPKTFARAQAKPPKMRPISEILGKEDTSMKFADFDLDKQATLVADEYNKKTTITEIREKFDINVYKLYKLLDHAKSMGISVTMRGSCAPQPKLVAPAKKQDPVVSKEEAGQAAKTTVDDFASAAKARLEQAEKLAREADLLQQAGTIALAIEELLGDRAVPVIQALYSEVV